MKKGELTKEQMQEVMTLIRASSIPDEEFFFSYCGRCKIPHAFWSGTKKKCYPANTKQAQDLWNISNP